MNPAKTRRYFSRSVLIRMLVLFVVAVVLLVWQGDFITSVYFKNQLTQVGWVINGGIVAMFLIGLFRLAGLLRRYMLEEAALNRFLANVQRGVEPEQGIDPHSMITTRYATLQDLYKRRAPINQSALAAALMASESSLVGFPKFVNNILILTGVFGTIVSLSIALLGASSMIGSTAELGGLGTVIHGMSTALSTTMTAILSYFFFGYFYMKLTDVQTYVISRVEHITATVLMPKFQIQQETILKDFVDLVRAAGALVQRIEEAQGTFAGSAKELTGLLSDYRNQLDDMRHGFDDIKALLRDGFRLPTDKS